MGQCYGLRRQSVPSNVNPLVIIGEILSDCSETHRKYASLEDVFMDLSHSKKACVELYNGLFKAADHILNMWDRHEASR